MSYHTCTLNRYKMQCTYNPYACSIFSPIWYNSSACSIFSPPSNTTRIDARRYWAPDLILGKLSWGELCFAAAADLTYLHPQPYLFSLSFDTSQLPTSRSYIRVYPNCGSHRWSSCEHFGILTERYWTKKIVSYCRHRHKLYTIHQTYFASAIRFLYASGGPSGARTRICAYIVSVSQRREKCHYL